MQDGIDLHARAHTRAEQRMLRILLVHVRWDVHYVTTKELVVAIQDCTVSRPRMDVCMYAKEIICIWGYGYGEGRAFRDPSGHLSMREI